MTEFSRCNELWIKAFILFLWLYVKVRPIFFLSPCNILLFRALSFLILTFCAETGSLILPCCSNPILLAWNTRPKKTRKSQVTPFSLSQTQRRRLCWTLAIQRYDWYLASWEATVMSPSKRRHLITWQTSSFIAVHWMLLLWHSPCNLCTDNSAFITETWTTRCVWVSFFIECSLLPTAEMQPLKANYRLMPVF